MFQAFVWFGRNLQENVKKNTLLHANRLWYIIKIIKEEHIQDHTLNHADRNDPQLSTRMSKHVPEPGVMLPGCSDAHRMKWRRGLPVAWVRWSIMSRPQSDAGMHAALNSHVKSQEGDAIARSFTFLVWPLIDC